jgi:hypothetical protein
MTIWLKDNKIVQRPKQIADTINPTDKQLEAAGYAQQEAPEGDRKYWVIADNVARAMDADEKATLDAQEAAAAEAAAEQAAIEQAEYLAGRDIFVRAVEAPVYIVHSESSKKGIGISSTDDGRLVTYLAHESPYDHEAAQAAKDKAIENEEQLFAAGKAGTNGQIQQRIENIERYLGWRK